MKHLFAAILLITLAATATQAAVDPGLLALVTPDAKVLVGVQVAQTVASPFGQYLFSQIPNDGNVDKVMSAIGFDPRRDIKELLAASGDVPSAAIVLGRGSFQPDKIVTAAKLAGAVSSNYRGFEILSGPNNAAGNSPKATVADRPGALVFLDGSTLAMGDIASVKAAIDRRAANTVFSGTLADRAKIVSASNDIWFATLTPPSGVLLGGASSGAGPNGQGNPVQTMLQSALQASGGIKFATTAVTVSAEVLAKSPQDAQSMIDVLRFGASMIQMNRKQGGVAANAASLLDSATFTTNGSVAKASISLPEQQIEQLIMPQAGAKTKKVAATRQ
jgi:hypothetical protein